LAGRRDSAAHAATHEIAAIVSATALVMWSTGVGDPVLWGTVAFILNYVPILEPVAAIFIFLFAGLTNADEMLRSRVRQLLKEAPRITLGVSPERPHRHWQKRAGDRRP
jgi:hypothetical protein